MSEDRPTSVSGKKSWLEKVADAFNDEPRDRKEIIEILKEANENQILDDESFTIIQGAMKVSELHVRDIMVPRPQMICLDDEDSAHDMLTEIVESGFSRFPVIGDNSDEVQGVVLAKDLLALGIKTKFDNQQMTARIKEIMREVIFVPESKRLNSLLNDFRSNRQHLAIVVDEYGGTAGLVTIEDVLEEIVGEIDDEHDDEADSNITPLGQGNFKVDALTPIDEFNEHFNCEFNDDEYDTIGGIVTHSFGRLPKRDESIEIQGMVFKVANADDRRLRSLVVIIELE